MKILGGEYAREGIRDLRNKDVVDDLRGAWFVELEELVVSKREDVATLKSFISRTEDRARLSYDRRSVTWARRFVLVGTTNENVYLRDDTGNRRFLPVRVPREIDLEGFRLAREQLFAEAVARWDADPRAESLVLPRKYWSFAEREQEKRRVVDPWEEIVSDWLNAPRQAERKGIRAREVLEDAISVPPERQTKHLRNRVGVIMRRLRWTDFGTVRDVVDGESVRFQGFKRPPSPLD